MNPERSLRPEVSGAMVPESAPVFEASKNSQEPVPGELQPESTEALGVMSVESVLREERIDVSAAKDLAREKVNRVFWAAEKYGQFTPAVVSAIVHRSEPSVEVIYPTAAQIKEGSFGARFISGFLGFFSSSWAERFDRYIERKSRQKVSYAARQTTQTLDAISGVKSPKAQFVREITSIHGALNHQQLHERLPQLINELATSGKQSEDDDYPLLRSLARLPGVAGRLVGRKRTVRALTPEIIQGVERFLDQRGVKVESVLVPEYKSFTRQLAQRFTPRKLEKLPGRIEKMLTDSYLLLPEDGERFRKSFEALCQNILIRNLHGEDGRTLTKTLLQEIKNTLAK